MATFSVDPYLMWRRMQTCQGYIKPLISAYSTKSPRLKKVPTVMKPPNVLVYQPRNIPDCPKECVNNIIETCLPLYKFVIYRLRYEEAIHDPWMDNCQLLVIPNSTRTLGNGETFREMDYSEMVLLQKYLSSGGKILNFSDEVAEYFKCRFLVTARTVKDCTFINKNNRMVAENHVSLWNANVICSNSNQYSPKEGDVVLSAKYADGGMDAVAVKYKQNGGDILHSALPLLVICSSIKHCPDFTNDHNSIILFKQLLGELGFMDKMSSGVVPTETPCVILCSEHDELRKFLDNFEIHQSGLCIVKSRTTTLKFVEVKDFKKENTQPISPDGVASSVPVFYCLDESSALPSVHFDWMKFRNNLHTENFGKVVIYSDVVSSTMDIVEPFVGKMLHRTDINLTCIANQQTSGHGRGGNKWLSPPGTAMFSHVLSVRMRSNLGQHMSILQHLTTVAVVHSVRSIPELNELDLRVKWPNDIYIGKTTKIGGVLVKSTVFNDQLVATIGCGVSVSNDIPTKCINDAIREANITHPPLTCEEVLARTISCLENLINVYQVRGPKHFLAMYYKYWIHNNQKIQVCSPETGSQTLEATIIGVDDAGFLRVILMDGKEISLQPDSNSFDMTKNLIAMKSSH